MKSCLLILSIALVVLTGCASKGSTIGGTTVTNVSAQTTDDLAACGMGISSSTGMKLGAAIEKNGGKVDASINDELKTAFVAKLGEKDALDGMKVFTICMKDRSDERKATKKEAEVSMCKAAWRCDMNLVAGRCTCRKTMAELQKQYSWTEAKTALEVRNNCGSDFQKCWPSTNLQKERASCETVLAEANVPMLTFSSATCKVSG